MSKSHWVSCNKKIKKLIALKIVINSVNLGWLLCSKIVRRSSIQRWSWRRVQTHSDSACCGKFLAAGGASSQLELAHCRLAWSEVAWPQYYLCCGWSHWPPWLGSLYFAFFGYPSWSGLCVQLRVQANINVIWTTSSFRFPGFFVAYFTRISSPSHLHTHTINSTVHGLKQQPNIVTCLKANKCVVYCTFLLMYDVWTEGTKNTSEGAKPPFAPSWRRVRPRNVPCITGSRGPNLSLTRHAHAKSNQLSLWGEKGGPTCTAGPAAMRIDSQHLTNHWSESKRHFFLFQVEMTV